MNENKINIRREVIIPEKMSNSGSIHDLESDKWDTVLRFVGGRLYAVLLPAFYNARPVFTKSREAAIARARLETRAGYESVRVIDALGCVFEVEATAQGYELFPIGKAYVSREI